MRRHALGLLSLGLLLAAALCWRYLGVGDDHGGVITSACLRIGLVLGAIWLALPQLQMLRTKTSPRFLAAMGLGALIVLVRPRTFIVVLPVMLGVALLQMAGWVLRPPARRMKNRTQQQKTREENQSSRSEE